MTSAAIRETPAPPTVTVPVTLWRCVACGKWSHAKRRPRVHERTLDWNESREGKTELRADRDRGYDHLNGSHDESTIVACGPFGKWTAVPV